MRMQKSQSMITYNNFCRRNVGGEFYCTACTTRNQSVCAFYKLPTEDQRKLISDCMRSTCRFSLDSTCTFSYYCRCEDATIQSIQNESEDRQLIQRLAKPRFVKGAYYDNISRPAYE